MSQFRCVLCKRPHTEVRKMLTWKSDRRESCLCDSCTAYAVHIIASEFRRVMRSGTLLGVIWGRAAQMLESVASPDLMQTAMLVSVHHPLVLGRRVSNDN